MAAQKKLTSEQVKSIRLAREKGESQASLAEKYGVHTSTIRAAENASGAYGAL